jgi:hypothetical protein
MYFLPVKSIENYKNFSWVIKKHLGMKLALVLENLAMTFGYRDYHAVTKFAAENAENAEQSIYFGKALSDDQIKLWVKQLEVVFGTEVLAVFEQRSHVEWLMSICAVNYVPTDHDDVELSKESDSEHLKASPEVSAPPPVVIYKKRRKIEFP